MLRLVDVDTGMRRVRVIGKGDREQIVPVDRVSSTAGCFVVLPHTSTAGSGPQRSPWLFTLICQCVQADLDLLLTKNSGHSVRRWVNGFYPDDT
ncbi:MAG: hypothetical protein GY722_26710 [bacterium]|nr:hypothetical protein [bacterium]